MTVTSSQPSEQTVDLDAHFKSVVTDALDEILQKRPDDPIRLLADRLREQSAQHLTERHTCHVAPGLCCTLTRASTRCDGADLLEVSGLPVLRLLSPTAFEMDAAIRRLCRSGESQVFLFVEPPPPLCDLFFMKGIPYRTDVTKQLLQWRRRRHFSENLQNSHVDEENRQRKKNDATEEELDRCIGSPEAVASLLTSALDTAVSTLENELKALDARVVMLPLVQSNFLDVFDVIDTALYGPARASNQRKGTGMEITKVPLVLHVSYNHRAAATTFARIIAAILPQHEAVQRRQLALTREEREKELRALHYNRAAAYWADVLRRRTARDQARAQTTASRGLNAPGVSPGNSVKNVSTAEDFQVSSTAGCSGPITKNSFRCRSLRARRREQEDAAFLTASCVLQSVAATRVQSAFRGYRCRRNLAPLRNATKAFHNASTATATLDAKVMKPKGLAIVVDAAPPGLPPLLRRTAERLAASHGELFANYNATPPPAPRRIPVMCPVRCPISEGDVQSESESWVPKVIALPPRRMTRPPPHFNPLRRLMECERIARSDAATFATAVQSDCGGLSVLQRRAYDVLKSLVLNLLHIAYLELRLRNQLPLLVESFPDYVHRFHTDVLAWFSAPHLFSRITCYTEGHLNSGQKGELATKESINAVWSDRETVETERVLTAYPYSRNTIFAPWTPRNTAIKVDKRGASSGGDADGDAYSGGKESTKALPKSSETPEEVFICEGVYAAPEFLSEATWEAALRQLIERNVTRVSWWSLSPHPAVYVAGEPYVLFPRDERQEVLGRPRYDEASLRVIALPAVQICSSSQSLLPSPFAARPTRYSGSPALGSTSSPRRCSIVSDGLAVSNSTLSLRPMMASEESPPDPRAGETPLTSFGALLSHEESKLAMMIAIAQQQTQQETQTHPNERGENKNAPPQDTIPSFVIAEDGRLLPGKLPRRRHAPSASRLSRYDVMDDTPSGATMTTPPLGNSMRSSRRASLIRSGRRRSERGESWSRAAVCAGISTELPSCLDPRLSITMEDREAEARLVGTVEATASLVSRRAGFVPGTVLLERPWLTPVCGRPWLRMMDAFLHHCLSRQRADFTMVISHNESDPSQRVLFYAACLLRHAAQDASRMENSSSNVDWINSPVFGAPRVVPPPPPLVSAETHEALRVMDDLFTSLATAMRHSEVSIPVAAHTVQAVMMANSRGGLAFLNDIPSLTREAEGETDVRCLEERIVRLVRRFEEYGWLVLLQVFLASPATTGVFEAGSKAKLPSFAVFVDDAEVLPCMDRIDPWKYHPSRSPDPFHQRYSNGLRRWDDRSYIFHGAI